MVVTFVRRAVSPVTFESAPAHYEEIICHGSENEDSSDEHVRNRRRRIEALGTQYLQGRGLFIQSAGLRGPFERDWRNPWAEQKRSRRAGDVGPYPGVRSTKSKERGAGEPVTAKRRSESGEEVQRANESPVYRAVSGFEAATDPEPTAKRRRRDESAKEDSRPASKQEPVDEQNDWLKDNTTGVAALSGQSAGSPTAMAAARVRAAAVGSTRTQNVAEHARQQGFTAINGKPSGRDQRRQPAPASQKQEHTYGSQTRLFGKQEKSHKSGSKDEMKHSLEYFDKTSPLRRDSQDTPKRLAPYVSSIIVEQASSGKLISKHKNHSPRPSPHIVPPSTNLPAFQYQYARQGSASTSDRSAAFVDAPESFSKRGRSNSESSISSSGSSAFAEALNAAQAKAESAARASSPSPMPKANGDAKGQARRLSFTASGKPNVRTSRPSSRSGANSIDPALLNKSRTANKSGQSSGKTTSLSKSSSKLSDKPWTIGDQSREILPEAQIEPNAPVPLVPSGPSTNLLETEKQSPRLLNFDEGDSYMNLSTQAAILRAQKSFQEDVLANLHHSPEDFKKPECARSMGKNTTTTPVANGQHSRTRKSRQSKPRHSEAATKEEPLSTQAMINDMSPFAVTTIKKKPLPTITNSTKGIISTTSPSKAKSKINGPGPTRNHQFSPPISPGDPPISIHGLPSKPTLSFSTSPSSSERSPSPPAAPPPLSSGPPTTRYSSHHHQHHHHHQNNTAASNRGAAPSSSALTSFSILPNGTFSETQVLQDGQRLPQVEGAFPPPMPPTWAELGFSAEGVGGSGGDDDDDDAFAAAAGGGGKGRMIGGGGGGGGGGSLERKGMMLGDGLASTGSAAAAGEEEREGEKELDTAIEEAGVFLGGWDVEAEARREGGGGGGGEGVER